MKVVLSGRAGAAMVIDGDAWYRIDADRLEVVQPSGRHEWQHVFGMSQDLRYLDVDSYDAVRAALTAAVDEDHSLSLALICLDTDTRDETRAVAAKDLETILERTPNAGDFLWRVFASRPLPPSASLARATEVAHGVARAFFERLDRSQPAIAEVRKAWERIPRDTFAELDAEEVFAFAVHSGLFATLADALLHAHAIEMLPNVELPENWNAADLGRIVWQWAAAIRSGAIASAPAAPESPRAEETRVPWQEPRTYFAAADPDLEVLQHVDFHGSLLNNLLFRRELLIPDTYLCESQGIREHMSARDTLLEAGVAAGLIVCACRGSDGTSTYPVDPTDAACLQATANLDRLQRAGDRRGPHGATTVWRFRATDELSEKHMAILRADDPPQSAQSLSAAIPRTWEAMRPWRATVIDEARDASVRNGRRGIGKRELFGALVRIILGVAPAETPSLSEFLERVERDRGAEMKERVAVFWSWSSEGFRFSDAGDLGALIYSPAYDRVQNLFVTAALGAIGDTGSDTVRVNVRMPAIETLKRIPPAEIIRLRLGAGSDYLRAIEEWHSRPERRRSVEEALERYVGEIARVSSELVSDVQFREVEVNVGRHFTSMRTNRHTDVVVNDVH